MYLGVHTNNFLSNLVSCYINFAFKFLFLTSFSFVMSKQERIMEFLTLDFKGLEYGIQLKNKSNLRLLNCLKKNSKIIFYANTRFFSSEYAK